MDKKLMQRWVKALRSGQYKQNNLGYLKSGDTYCCLGVLCVLEGMDLSKHDGRGDMQQTYPGKSLRTCSGDLRKEYKTKNGRRGSLTELNDNGLSFKQIANIIEHNYEDL